MELNQIYEPVQSDLYKVEGAIKSICDVKFLWLAQLLSQSLGSGGKRIRPALTLLSGKFYNYQVDLLLHMATAIELMHTATLIHDDAIDKSDTRRGKQTIYKLWGVDPAILLGDYLFARAGVENADTQNLRAVRIFSQTLMTISQGELIQAKNAFNISQTRKDYYERIYGKTASLFCLATESGGILSQATENSTQILRDYGYNLGLAFQIVDDVLDYIGTEEELGKPAGSDLLQGTLTLPAILLNERYPQDNPVKRLFQNRESLENIQIAIEQIRNSTIVDECYRVAEEFCDKARKHIQDMPVNPAKNSLSDLTYYVLKRKK